MASFNAMSEQEVVAQKVWNLFEEIRGEVRTEDYSVILLFTFLYSQNLISEQLLEKSNDKKELFSKLYNKKNVPELISIDEYHKVLEAFYSSIDVISNQSIHRIFRTLRSVDIEFLKENISVIFDAILHQLSSSQGKTSGQFTQPKELTEFISGYVGEVRGLNIFNPFSGAGSYIKDFNSTNSISAQEVNRKTWAIGMLRLLAYNVKVDLRCENTLHNWPSNEKFDLILSTPPFGLRVDDIVKESNPGIRIAEHFLLEKGVDSLTANGKLIAVIPNGFLFRGGAEKILREQLIHEDLIDTIITFPGGLLKHTSIPFLVLVISKKKSNPGEIRMINAESFTRKLNSRESIVAVDELLEVCEENNDNEYIRIVKNETVVENEYNLNVPRYFQESIDGVKLEELLTTITGNRKGLPKSGKLIRISDLRSDIIDFKLDYSELSEAPLKLTSRLNEKTFLLLSKVGTGLKPTLFNSNGEIPYLSDHIHAFHVNEGKVDISYLVNELHSEYVQKQLESFRVGMAMPRIHLKDLLEIRINLPSMEEQRGKVSGLRELSKKIKQLTEERNNLAHGSEVQSFNEYASLKHTLGSPRQNILAWSKNLSRFFESKKDTLQNLNIEFKEFFDVDMVEAINEVNRDIKFISEVIEKGEGGLILENFEKEIVSLSELNTLINLVSNNDMNFKIVKQLNHTEKVKEKGVLVNETLFKVLLNNILTNANKYGFDEKLDNNEVLIEFNEIDDYLVIDIKNNGKPFPKNYDQVKFITKYNTADTTRGSGIGGYDINRIAGYFENKDWELMLNTDPIYPVNFRFKLSIQLIK